METRKMVQTVKDIKMSQDMQERIISNCYKEKEETTMKKNTKIFKKPLVAAASLILCFCLAGVTGLAASGRLQGYFKDIVGWNGAVTGTSYEQATDEIEMNITEVSDVLMVELKVVNPNVPPYSTFDAFGIKEYRIVDANGKAVAESKEADMGSIVDGKVNVGISLDAVTSGEYKLIVSKLIGSSKADQPLEINGTWECAFVR